MIDKQTMIDRFTMTVAYPNVEVIRKRLLRSCSTNSSDALAAERAYDIMFKTELKDLILATWETIELVDLSNTESLENINNSMEYVKDHVFPAISEISEFIPVETRDALKELYSTQAPILRVAIMIFIVAVTALEDLL